MSLWTNVQTPKSAAICELPLWRTPKYLATGVRGHKTSACEAGKGGLTCSDTKRSVG